MDILDQNQVNEQQINAQNNTTMTSLPPKTWFVEAILATVFCCMPFGIAGIVYAAKVEPYYVSGKIIEAQLASSNAKKWTLIGVGVAILGWILYFAFFASIFAAMYSNMD